MIKVKFMGPYKNLMPADKDADGYWITDGAGRTIEQFLDGTPVKDHFMNCSVVVNSYPKQKDYVLEEDDVLLVIPLFRAG